MKCFWKKKQSRLAEIVHEYTAFPNGKYHHYLSVPELHTLFGLIMQTGETAEYIKAIPFYRNMDRQLELDAYMFFVKRLPNGESESSFLRACAMGENGQPNKGVIRCYKEQDVQAFQNALQAYLEYLNTLVHEVYELLVKEYGLQNEDLLSGSICFEINVGQ